MSAPDFFKELERRGLGDKTISVMTYVRPPVVAQQKKENMMPSPTIRKLQARIATLERENRAGFVGDAITEGRLDESQRASAVRLLEELPGAGRKFISSCTPSLDVQLRELELMDDATFERAYQSYFADAYGFEAEAA